MTHSIIDKNGEESIDFCVACNIDKLTGHCDGQILSFENNHLKQTCKIVLGVPRLGDWKVLQTLRGEVLSEKECINWMNENGYIENCMCKEREENETDN